MERKDTFKSKNVLYIIISFYILFSVVSVNALYSFLFFLKQF